MLETSNEILGHVNGALDQLIEIGNHHAGLFPSMIDRSTNDMLLEIPPAIPGQRIHDRANHGSNLTHDEPTLMTLYALGVHQKNTAYTNAADRYLKRFATHCTDTPTGLFPWGEHSCWNLVDDCVGNIYRSSGSRDVETTHDHLRSTPLWLWEKLNTYKPECVQQFAVGLRSHWLPADDTYPLEYSRHAYMDSHEPYAGGHIEYSPDFPRHGGFYIFDWAYAYSQSHNIEHLLQLKRMLDYHWQRKNPDNLLFIESRPRPNSQGSLAVTQTLSLASSLLEAAVLVESAAPALADEMRDHAYDYIEGFFRVSTGFEKDHEPCVFYNLWNPDEPQKSRIASIWGSSYGKTPVCYGACNALCVYRLTHDKRLLEYAKAAGRGYMREAFPTDVQAPAMDAGMGLGLLADLYDITGDSKWLEGALTLSKQLVAVYFEADKALPRGAAGIDWYESQMGPGFLLHGLARTALLAQDKDNCMLEADYTGR